LAGEEARRRRLLLWRLSLLRREDCCWSHGGRGEDFFVEKRGRGTVIGGEVTG
jgi:hypothetical protein